RRSEAASTSPIPSTKRLSRVALHDDRCGCVASGPARRGTARRRSARATARGRPAGADRGRWAVGGGPGVEHVVSGLRPTRAVGEIIVSGLERHEIANLPALASVATSPSGSTPSASVLAALDAPGGCPL